MRIKQTDRSYTIVPFGTGGDNFKNALDKARNRKKKTEWELIDEQWPLDGANETNQEDRD